jgi:hypothetical protein
MLSSNILSRDSLEKDDYLVAADVLRAKAVRVIRTIEKMEKLPGALTIRTAKDAVSLSEIRACLEDSIRFDLEPLLGIIRSEGITKNARLLSLYATNMVFQLRLDKQETEARAQALRAALREYVAHTAPGGVAVGDGANRTAPRSGGLDGPALMPQLSESFLTRLQEMAAVNQKDEMEYRRKLNDQVIAESLAVATFDKELQYYLALGTSIQELGRRTGGSPELVTLVKNRSEKSFSTIEKAINQLTDLYRELSRQNLDPDARLYAITGPFAQRTQKALSTSNVALSFVLAILLTLVLMPVGCVIHNALRNRAA